MRTLCLLGLLLVVVTAGCSNSASSPTSAEHHPLRGNRIPVKPGQPPPSNR
jgi:hypothetical protein